MKKETVENITRTGTFFSSVQGIITTIGAIAMAIIGGYIWLEDHIAERNSKIISAATVEQIKAEINPVSLATFHDYRRADSIKHINATLMALEYMNKIDSMLLIIQAQNQAIQNTMRSISRLEAKIDATTMHSDDDKLSRIWEFLKKQEARDSTQAQLTEIMSEIRRINFERIHNIKSGDRAE